MAKYIAKRIGLAIVTCWLVATLTFFLMNLVPGGPFMAEKALTPQAQQAMMKNTGWTNHCRNNIPFIWGRCFTATLARV